MAKIPGAVNAGVAPQPRQNPWEQLLIGLIGNMGGALTNRALIGPSGNQLAAGALRTQQEGSTQQLLQPQMAQTPAGSQWLRSLGNANVPSAQVLQQAPMAVEAGTQQAEAAAEAKAMADKAAAEQSAYERAMGTFASHPNGAALGQMFTVGLNMGKAGLDASTINSIISPMVPPDQKELLEIAKDRLDLNSAENEVAAEAWATGRLKSLGILGQDAPERFTGAVRTLDSVLTAREGKRINWLQEGLDFVQARIGDSITGSPFAVAADGRLSINASPENAVTVEQAITEWRRTVEQFAPPGERQAILRQLDSGDWQNKLTLEAAKTMVTSMLSSGQITEEQARAQLASGFTPGEIQQILNAARRRSDPTQQR